MYNLERCPNLVLKLNVPFALKDGEKIKLDYAPARKADGTVLVPAFIRDFGGKAEKFEGREYFALESLEAVETFGCIEGKLGVTAFTLDIHYNIFVVVGVKLIGNIYSCRLFGNVVCKYVELFYVVIFVNYEVYVFPQTACYHAGHNIPAIGVRGLTCKDAVVVIVIPGI